MTSYATDYVAVVGAIDPDAIVASTVTTSYIDASKYHSYMAVVMAGTLGASGTLDAKLEQAQDSGGTGVKDVTGKAITQLTQAGSDSDKQAIINLLPEELDVEGGFSWFRLSMTIATATSDAAGFVLGCTARHAPASDDDASTVDEIVS